ncbi:MAG TPA: hypothetical protein PLP30_11605 [Clostridia bacterium]|nr:hypothetical protein [Clostridia bacterium]
MGSGVLVLAGTGVEVLSLKSAYGSTPGARVCHAVGLGDGVVL